MATATSAPLEQALLAAMSESTVDFHRTAEDGEEGEGTEGEVDATGGAAAAEAEASGCVGTAAAEALVKLVLRHGGGALADAPHIVTKLLAAYLGVDARARPRLAQCLAVFFPALASAPADRRRLIAAAALPALRDARNQKGVARVAAYLAHLLNCAPAEAAVAVAADADDEAAVAASPSAGSAPAAGGEVLVGRTLNPVHLNLSKPCTFEP